MTSTASPACNLHSGGEQGSLLELLYAQQHTFRPRALRHCSMLQCMVDVVRAQQAPNVSIHVPGKASTPQPHWCWVGGVAVLVCQACTHHCCFANMWIRTRLRQHAATPTTYTFIVQGLALISTTPAATRPRVASAISARAVQTQHTHSATAGCSAQGCSCSTQTPQAAGASPQPGPAMNNTPQQGVSKHVAGQSLCSTGGVDSPGAQQVPSSM